jgi:outer membrane protein OmpA-like peptidoglycan-associated protein
MSIRKYIIMLSVSVFIYVPMADAQPNSAAHSYKKMGYVPSYMGKLTQTQKSYLNFYTQNEEREPCQHYYAPPPGFYRDGCALIYRYPEKKVSSSVELKHQKSLSVYEIHFEFDSTEIDKIGTDVLTEIADDIDFIRPSLVTVSGFTDSVGTEKYNIDLSQRRAIKVSDFLKKLGVENQVIDEKLRSFVSIRPAISCPRSNASFSMAFPIFP